MMVIGVTGGTGVGKSLASKYMNEKGFELLDADEIGRMLVQPGMPALDEYVDAFGKDILNEDGTLNRRKLGGMVFSDSEKLEILNGIIQRRIKEYITEQIDAAEKKDDVPGIVIDAALLFEHDYPDICDEIWVVDADEDVRISRIMARDGISEKAARDRMGSQMDNRRKKEMADVVLDNSSSRENLYRQVEEQIERLGKEKNY